MTVSNRFDRVAKGGSVIDEHVGQRLRSRREMIGMSKQNLARNVSLSSEDISRIEDGVSRPKAELLSHFASLLGCPVSSFFEGAEIAVEKASLANNVFPLKS